MNLRVVHVRAIWSTTSTGLLVVEMFRIQVRKIHYRKERNGEGEVLKKIEQMQALGRCEVRASNFRSSQCQWWNCCRNYEALQIATDTAELPGEAEAWAKGAVALYDKFSGRVRRQDKAMKTIHVELTEIKVGGKCILILLIQ